MRIGNCCLGSLNFLSSLVAMLSCHVLISLVCLSHDEIIGVLPHE